MIYDISDRLILSRFEIKPAEIPSLLALRNIEFGDTLSLEQMGSSMHAAQINSKLVKDFVEKVFVWGKGKRNLNRVLASLDCLTIKLVNACIQIESDNDSHSIGLAIKSIQVPYLRMSFASKLIRFIYPERAVIFDSVIRTGLGYPETAAGYTAFLEDCKAILERTQMVYPELRICDVEAAIFMKLRR